MNSVLVALFASSFRARAALQAETLALRHQLAVLHKNAPPRLPSNAPNRWLWGPAVALLVGLAIAEGDIIHWPPARETAMTLVGFDDEIRAAVHVKENECSSSTVAFN